jgi:hypothetical protein
MTTLETLLRRENLAYYLKHAEGLTAEETTRLILMAMKLKREEKR